MRSMEAQKTMYGTKGSLWIDGELIAEVTGVSAKIELEKTEVKMAGHMSKGYKVTGFSGKGSFTLNKVSSYFIKKFAPVIAEGKQVLFTLVSAIDDPDSIGAERVALYNCSVDSVDLINWKVGELGEESYDFTFESFELLDVALED